MIYDRNNLPEELLNLPASDFEALYREDIKDEKFQTKPVGFFKDAAIRLTKSKVSIIAFIIIGIIIILAIVVPPLSPYGFNDQNINAKYLPPKMPIVEKLGIMDGTRVLKSRKVSALTDPERYPEGSVIEYFKW